MIGESIKEGTFAAAGRKGLCSIDETVVIGGVPRAGTTWMLELFQLLPGYKALNEPLMYEEARTEHRFGWHKYIGPNDSAPTQRKYLERVLTGQLGISPAWFFEADSRPAQLLEHATRQRLVVKFCRLNRMLHWFSRHFNVRGTVLVVRHPCAVVASMLRHGAWDEAKLHGSTRREQALHGDRLPEALRDPFDPILDRITSRVEVLAVHWCLDHHAPLLLHAHDGEYPWVLAPYERLVAHGSSELDRIAEALGLEATPQMRDQLREPSSSVEDQVHSSAERQLSKWQRRLTEAQIQQVLAVVDEVGLSEFYADALEPDYGALNGCQLPRARW
jgi:hypothetical protein